MITWGCGGSRIPYPPEQDKCTLAGRCFQRHGWGIITIIRTENLTKIYHGTKAVDLLILTFKKARSAASSAPPAEIYDDDFEPGKYFSTSSRWEDYITWIDGAGYVYPGYYFRVDNNMQKETYVFSKSGIENWRTYSELKIANPDPLSY